MLKLLLIFFSAFFVGITLHAQLANGIYFELGGPGLASFNYDTRFTKGNNGGIGGRIGMGGFSVDGESELFFPLEINYLLGNDRKHYFEMGAGWTVATYKSTSSDPSVEGGTFTESFGHLYFGYRLQPPASGFLFRAGICPVFGDGYFIPYYAGISFGYKFGSGRAPKN